MHFSRSDAFGSSPIISAVDVESQGKDLFNFFYATLKDRFMNMFKDLQNKKLLRLRGRPIE